MIRTKIIVQCVNKIKGNIKPKVVSLSGRWGGGGEKNWYNIQFLNDIPQYEEIFHILSKISEPFTYPQTVCVLRKNCVVGLE